MTRVPGLTQRSLTSMAWTGGGVAAQMALNTIVVMALARLLTPADFGLVAVASIATGFVGIFGELGLGPALIQRQTLDDRHVRTALAAGLVLALAMAVAVWAIAPWTASILGMPAAGPMMRVLGFALLIKAWASVPSALLQRAMQFRVLALAGVLSYIAGFGGVGVGLAVAGYGAWALVAARVAQVLTEAIALHVARPVSHRMALDRRALRDLMSFGTGATLARFANYLALRGDNLVVGYALGPAALGLYGRAYHLMALPAELFQKVVQTVLFPAAARVQAEPRRLAAAYRRSLAVTALAVLPVTGLATRLAPDLVTVLLGAQWTGVVTPLQILAVATFFRAGYKTSVVFIKAAGAVHRLAASQVPYPLMVLSLSWLGTRWGIAGVAAGVALALAVHYALVTGLGLRVVGLSAGDYLRAHRPAAFLALAVLGQAEVALAAAHRTALPAWATLAIVGLSTALTVAALVRWMPRPVLGDDGLWFRRSLTSVVAGRGDALARS